MIAEFFRRVVVQLKSPWLFFQLDFMNSFDKYLKVDRGNNSLMLGLNSGESLQDRKFKVNRERLQAVI
jgi:hypothetical protein